MGKIPAAYFSYFFSYAMAIRMLYEPILQETTINTAEIILKKYVEQLEEMYSKYACTYTTHAHLHLAEQVRQHGPLQGISQFCFEVLIFIFISI